VDYSYDGQARRGWSQLECYSQSTCNKLCASSRWTHRVYYTLVDCNTLTPLLRFVLDYIVGYNLFLYSVVQQCAQLWLTHRVAAVAELLVPTAKSTEGSNSKIDDT